MARTPGTYVGGGRVLTRTASGFKMYVAANDVCISPHIILDGVWEASTEASLRRIVKPKMHVLEIGANVGYFTLLMAQLAGPSGSVYAFECDPELAQIAEDNVEINGFTDRVTIDRRAAGETAGSAQFRRARRHRGGGTLVADLQQIPQLRETEREMMTVEVTTVDALLTQLGRTFDFVKIDAEGAETWIINGGTKLFADRRHPLTVLIEFCPAFLHRAGHDPAAQLRRFSDWGFDVRRLDSRRRRPVACSTEALLNDSYSELLLRRT
jgi:FkbM family methyltransferase